MIEGVSGTGREFYASDGSDANKCAAGQIPAPGRIVKFLGHLHGERPVPAKKRPIVSHSLGLSPVSLYDRLRGIKRTQFCIYLRRFGLLDGLGSWSADCLPTAGRAHSGESASSKNLASPIRSRASFEGYEKQARFAGASTGHRFAYVSAGGCYTGYCAAGAARAAAGSATRSASRPAARSASNGKH
jgi:hypothetical protein